MISLGVMAKRQTTEEQIQYTKVITLMMMGIWLVAEGELQVSEAVPFGVIEKRQVTEVETKVQRVVMLEAKAIYQVIEEETRLKLVFSLETMKS